MKRILAIFALIAVLLFTWVVPVSAFDSDRNHNDYGTDHGSSNTSWATGFFYKLGSGTVTAELIAGKNITAGTVTIWESNGKIIVQYDGDGWKLTETHLQVGRGLTCEKAESIIPQNWERNYTPEKFKWGNKHNPAVETYTYSIEEKTLGSGSWLYVAAYAIIQNTQNQKISYAWGDIVPVGDWVLPTSPITARMNLYPGSDNHYLDFELISGQLSASSKYSIHDQEIYSGWCVDTNGELQIDYNKLYNAKVYSSLDLKGVPANIAGKHWDMINYILNHNDPAVSWDNVQSALWYFTDNLQPPENLIYYPDGIPNNYDQNIVWGLIHDAQNNGSKFVPGPGQIGGVIIDLGTPFQIICVELAAPTRCYRESSCRHDCDPGWSPANWSDCQKDWNPRSIKSFNWDPKFTPRQNFDCFPLVNKSKK